MRYVSSGGGRTALWGAAQCEERRDGPLARGPPRRRQVGETDVEQCEVERRAAVHHLIEELHRQGNQMHISISAACWTERKRMSK